MDRVLSEQRRQFPLDRARRVWALGVADVTHSPASCPTVDARPTEPPQEVTDTTKTGTTSPPPKRCDPKTCVNAAVESEILSMDDAQQFLRSVADPTQDLEAAIHQVLSEIQTTSSTSAPVMVAPGVKLYQSLTSDQDQDRQRVWRARVRVGHCVVERIASTARATNVEALTRLIVTLREFRRVFGSLMDRLRAECGFPQPLDHRRAYFQAQNLCVGDGLSVVSRRCRVDGEIMERWLARAQIDGMTLGEARELLQADANARALHNAAVFLNDLVRLQHLEPVDRATAAARWSSRKRPLDEAIALAMAEPPPAVRPKRDLSETARDAAAEDALDTAHVAAYRQLVKVMFTCRAAVMAQLEALEWRDDVQVRMPKLADRFPVEQRVAKKDGRFECELRVCAGSATFTHDAERLSAAGRGVLDQVREWFTQVYTHWSTLATNFKNKKKKKPDLALSAAVETRQYHIVRVFVEEKTAARGQYTEFMVRVGGYVAVRRWAIKPKDAKRLANTEFCTLLEWILQAQSSRSKQS